MQAAGAIIRMHDTCARTEEGGRGLHTKGMIQRRLPVELEHPPRLRALASSIQREAPALRLGPQARDPDAPGPVAALAVPAAASPMAAGASTGMGGCSHVDL